MVQQNTMFWRLPTRRPRSVWLDARAAPIPDLSAAQIADASHDGIVAFGGELSVATLASAYRRGIFPWPHTGLPLLWFSPDPRAVLELSAVHVPKSLEKERKKTRLTFTIDAAFAQVIRACQTVKRPEQGGTWITPAMQAAYIALHDAGYAHSVEAWNESGELVGGLYGVDSGGVFGGESMFYREPYASKLCLLHLLDHLRARGASFIDIQQMTEHFAALGATEIPRDVFLAKLATEQARNLRLWDAPE